MQEDKNSKPKSYFVNSLSEVDSEQEEPYWDYFDKEPTYFSSTSSSSFLETEETQNRLDFGSLLNEIETGEPNGPMFRPNCWRPRNSSEQEETSVTFNPRLLSTGVIEEVESEVFQPEEEMAPTSKNPQTASEIYAAFLKSVKDWNGEYEDAVELGDNIFEDLMISLKSYFDALKKHKKAIEEADADHVSNFPDLKPIYKKTLSEWGKINNKYMEKYKQSPEVVTTP